MRMPAVDRIVQGELYWARVDIVDIALEAQGTALRTLLDQFLMLVRRFPVGQARHLLALLAGNEPTADYVVLSCHGEGGAILLPELHPRFEETQPLHGRVTADDVRKFARLPGRVIIATGCGTGNDELAQAFLDAGCTAYVAPTGGPHLQSVIVALTLLSTSS